MNTDTRLVLVQCANYSRPSLGWGRAALAGLVAVILVLAGFNANASTTLLGNPYTPQGANFSIYALQGLNLSTGQGSGGNPQVNRGFEFDDGIGVSYTNTNGGLTHFGLGLYGPNNAASTTGMFIRYNSLVNPQGITVKLEDFDIHANATFFNPNKVEPGVLFMGANGNVLANALPTDVWAALHNANGTASAGQDVWDLDLGQLAARMGLGNSQISGFILYADKLAGERPNSDPYFLVSAGNGIPVIPEPATYVAGFVALLFAVIFHVKQARRKKAIATR